MSNIAQWRFSDLSVGQTAEFTLEITRELVDRFAELSGDDNPLHTDDAFVATTVLGKRVAHGMISGMLFSRLIGTLLPGTHALYLSQTLRFRRPIFLNTRVVVHGTVLQLVAAEHVMKMRLETRDPNDPRPYVDGEALVRVSE
jgi:3-hydroxybutyryl-CoA dehydratase